MNGSVEMEGLGLYGNPRTDGGAEFVYASVGRRLLAGIVDWLSLTGWVFVAVMTASVATAIALLSSEYPFQTNFVAGIVFFGFPVASVVVVFRYVRLVLRVSSSGDTLGHRLFGLRIVDRNGEAISRSRSLGRHILGSPLLFVYVFPMIVLYLGVASFNADLIGRITAYWVFWGFIAVPVLAIMNHVWMALDDQGRGWHDTIAGTVVVKEVRQDDQ